MTTTAFVLILYVGGMLSIALYFLIAEYRENHPKKTEEAAKKRLEKYQELVKIQEEEIRERMAQLAKKRLRSKKHNPNFLSNYSQSPNGEITHECTNVGDTLTLFYGIKCYVCGNVSFPNKMFLCDFVKPDGRTCNATVCRNHAHKTTGGEKDFCQHHHEEYIKNHSQ